MSNRRQSYFNLYLSALKERWIYNEDGDSNVAPSTILDNILAEFLFDTSQVSRQGASESSASHAKHGRETQGTAPKKSKIRGEKQRLHKARNSHVRTFENYLSLINKENDDAANIDS